MDELIGCCRIAPRNDLAALSKLTNFQIAGTGCFNIFLTVNEHHEADQEKRRNFVVPR